MARTAPVPNLPPIPGMCPGIAAQGGGGDGGGGSGKGKGDGSDGSGGDGTNGNGDASGDGKGGGCAEGDPICPITGRMFFEVFDFGFGGPLPLRWTRSYSSASSQTNSEVGFGWSHNFAFRVLVKRRSTHVFDDHAKEQIFAKLPQRGEPAIQNPLGWLLSQTDLGIIIRADDKTYEFAKLASKDGFHHLVGVSDRNGNRISLFRDTNGLLTGLVDSAGRSYKVATDTQGRLVSIAVALDAANQRSMPVVQYLYDSAGDLHAAIDAGGYEARYTYEGHLLVEHRSPSELSYCYRYDGRGENARCIETWGEYVGRIDPALEFPIPPRPVTGADKRKVKGIHYRRLTYLPEERYCEAETGLGGVTRYFGDAANRGTKIINTAGGVVQRRFDPKTGGMIEESTEDGAVRKLDCDSVGRPMGYVNASGKGLVTFDTPDGTEVHFHEETNSASYERFDDRGNLIFLQHQDGTREEFEYDARGLIVHHINRLGAIERYWHDVMGNQTSFQRADGGVEVSEYDYLGRRVSHIDSTGARTEWVWDARSEIVLRRQADGSELRVDRDANRKPVRVEYAGQVTRYGWGGMAWLIEMQEPDGATTLIRYDTEGNRTYTKNARGQVFREVYDYASRCVACTTFEGIEMRAGYHASGLLKWRQTPLGRDVYERDDLSRLSAVECSDGQKIELSYGHGGIDAMDNGAVKITCEFDDLGRVVRDQQGKFAALLTWAGGELAEVRADIALPVSFGRGRFGELASIQIGNVYLSVDRAVGQDRLTFLGDKLVVRRHYSGSQMLVRVALARYDAKLNLPQEHLATTADPGLLSWTAYDYDAALRLRSEQHSDGRAQTYELDVAGRIVRRTSFLQGNAVSSEVIGYDAAGSPRVDGARFDAEARPIGLYGESFEYDKSGRLVCRMTDAGKWTYVWNALDQLVAVTAPHHRVEMQYDGRSRRVHKRVLQEGQVVRSIAYFWANDALFCEVDQTAARSRTYIRKNESWENLGHVDFQNDVTTACFYIGNQVGTPQFAVDESGTVVWKADSSVFGNCSPIVQTADVTARFAGQFYDEDVQLTYNRFRWYEPRLGLYVTPDPLLLNGTANPRDYVPNPTGWVDPLGLSSHTGPTTNAGSPAHGHPRPTRPTTLAGMDANYMGQPGAWATNGPPGGTPGWTPCPTNSLQPGQGFPVATQAAVDAAGQTHGCHSCGTTNSGWGNTAANGGQHWTADHQPPRSNYGAGTGNTGTSANVRLYPQCRGCSSRQGGFQSGMSHSQRSTNGAATILQNTNHPMPT